MAHHSDAPRSGDGTDHLENQQLPCGACNSGKGDRMQEYTLPRQSERTAVGEE